MPAASGWIAGLTTGCVAAGGERFASGSDRSHATNATATSSESSRISLVRMGRLLSADLPLNTYNERHALSLGGRSSVRDSANGADGLTVMSISDLTSSTTTHSTAPGGISAS